MANEVDSELPSAVTDPSSGSLLGEKTTGEGGSIHQTASSVHPHESQPQTSVSENEKKTTPIPSSPQSGNDPQSESVKKEDNVDKPERTGGADMHESSDAFKHTDEADEEKGDDKDHGQDLISDKKAELESVPSLKEKTTPIPSSPQSGNDPQSESVKKEDNVDKPERTGESPVNIQMLEEADMHESGDGFKHTDEADEEKGDNKDQGQDLISDKKAELESVPSLKEKTTLIPSSPQSGNDPQSESVKKEDNVDKPEKTGGADMHESGDGFKHTDEADEEKGDDKDHGQDYISDKKAELESVASLKEKTTPIPSSPQSGNDLQSESMKKEDNVDKPERTGESPVKVEETEKASGINERGDGFKRTDEADEDEYQDQESPLQNIQRPKEAEKTRDINESGEHTDETDEETESLQQTASSGLPQDNQPQIRVGGNDKLFLTVGVLLLSCCVGLYFTDSTPPVPKAFSVLDVFNREMEKVKTSFPNQRPELWRRSLIHLRRHLKTEQPTEPVSLILTSGHSAERTLGCLAKCLAQAFSTALNSSVLNINGKSKASQDSDQVKLDIDSELRNAFEGKKFAAVIHRFEELPPGSTLIFYRYCDHENAAYKNVFLAFTVMLDGEVEVPSSVNLGRVEEMVQEHVKQKFVSSDKLATFNQMDVDKLSGLWSRISHLILPVVVEEKIEHKGCGDCDK